MSTPAAAATVRLDTDTHRRLHERMRAASAALRLPLRSSHWRGLSGSLPGQGTGSSIDFHDQRAYVPGDDPRHINWLATARTGTPTMKLFRQEVTPRVDLLVDLSSSMFLTKEKAERVWELVYFCIESTLRLGGAPRIHLLTHEAREQPLESALGHAWEVPDLLALDLPQVLSRLPLRQGALRILVSDLLSPTPPEAALAILRAGQGRPLLLAPFCAAEAAPDWSGNIDFEDCESGTRSRRRVETDLRLRYLQAYETHFQCWRDQTARHSAVLARVPAELPFMDAMQHDALRAGAVELA